MRKLCFILFCCFISFQTRPQSAVVDTLKLQLTKAVTDEEKVEALSRLSRLYMNMDLAEAEKYGLQMIDVAERSRDRKLMVKSLLSNGERYSYLAGRKDNLDKSISYYKQGLELAKKNDLDEQVVSAYLALSEVSRYATKPEDALNYCNQAYSTVGMVKNDSLSAKVHFEYGSVYLLKNEKILALKNYMTGIRIAEDIKNDGSLRAGYGLLSQFYASLEDYDKAIDYQVKALKKLDINPTKQTPYTRINDLVKIGDLYTAKKNQTTAMHYYEDALKIADSVKFEPIKSLVYRSIISNYLNADEPQKALDYFNTHPQLKQFLEALRFGHFVDQSYGFIYMQLGKYDSAKYYYSRVAPFFENSVNNSNQFSYYFQLGKLFRYTREFDKAEEYLLKAKQMSEGIGNLEAMRLVITDLDSLYQLKGDYKQASYYAAINYKYKDSLQKLSKEKDLIQIEVADEQQRQERIAKEELEKKNKRHNIQYMLITIGIATLFIFMVMLGMFKVSANTIKMIGFFTFLMFFEFIFLIFKKNIYGITKGEPWKDLAFMILLAAILLPFHHWVEHKVIHYLTSHNRLTASGKGLLNKIFKKQKIEIKTEN